MGAVRDVRAEYKPEAGEVAVSMRECQSIEFSVLVRGPYKREPRIGCGGCRRRRKSSGSYGECAPSPEPLFCRDWGPEQSESKSGLTEVWGNCQLGQEPTQTLCSPSFVLRPIRGGGLCNVIQDPVKHTTKASSTPLCTSDLIGSYPIIRMDTDLQHPRTPEQPLAQHIDGIQGEK